MAEKHTVEFLQTFFAAQGCTLTSTAYGGAQAPLEFVCRCDRPATVRWNNFRVHKRCGLCGREAIPKARRHSYEFVRAEFEKRGYTLLSPTYESCSQKLAIRCPRGHEVFIQFTNFYHGAADCIQCRPLKNTGVLSPHWNPELTDEHRMSRSYLRPKLFIWMKAVFERDDFTCRYCGERGGKLNAHHLSSYDRDPGNRLNIDNGATLHRTCHRQFHRLYGQGANTPEQFAEWLENRKAPGVTPGAFVASTPPSFSPGGCSMRVA